MLDLLKNPIIFQILSLAGALSAILGSLTAAAAYRGRQGETYSLLNHFISELGEAGVSRLAWVFNLGLILCGLCLVPASAPGYRPSVLACLLFCCSPPPLPCSRTRLVCRACCGWRGCLPYWLSA